MYNINYNNTARIARFGSGGAILRSKLEPLLDEQIIQAAPSVFAMEKHISRSDKYTYIPTSEVLKGLRKEGFQPFEVRQGGSRDHEKRGFTKHMIRLRQEGSKQTGDSFREIILVNAHDGTSSYQLMSGVFRLVCSNGLVVADGQAQCLKIPHKGDIVGQVIEGAYQVINEGEMIDNAMEAMQSIELHPSEQRAFAAAAAQLRFEDDKNPIEPEQVIRARRGADVGNDLWKTFNRAQENLVNGGVHFHRQNPETGRYTRGQTRPVNSIDDNVKLNRALWTLAAEMQKLKAA